MFTIIPNGLFSSNILNPTKEETRLCTQPSVCYSDQQHHEQPVKKQFICWLSVFLPIDTKLIIYLFVHVDWLPNQWEAWSINTACRNSKMQHPAADTDLEHLFKFSCGHSQPLKLRSASASVSFSVCVVSSSWTVKVSSGIKLWMMQFFTQFS